MTLTGAFIVRLDVQTGELARVETAACAGHSWLEEWPGGLPPEGAVCGHPGRRRIAGVWLCAAHERAVIADAPLRACADEDRAVHMDSCVFPLCGPSPDVARLCGKPAVTRIGLAPGAPACKGHHEEVMAWHRQGAAREKAEADAIEEAAAQVLERTLASWAAQGPQIVYYLRRPSDGAIKIGTSKSFDSRYQALAKDHGELQLLLSHCGGYPREHEMHRKFAPLALGGEWFRPGAELLEWIVEVRRKPRNGRTRIRRTVPLSEVRALLRQAQENKAA